jgi:hypothetical protein
MCIYLNTRQPAPVDKVIFLHVRTKCKRTEAAILVSSEAGVLRWWSIFGVKKELGIIHDYNSVHYSSSRFKTSANYVMHGCKFCAGYFYAPQGKENESVLALCTNHDDSLLISGDTSGGVAVWEIETYCTVPENHVRKCETNQTCNS